MHDVTRAIGRTVWALLVIGIGPQHHQTRKRVCNSEKDMNKLVHVSHNTRWQSRQCIVACISSQCEQCAAAEAPTRAELTTGSGRWSVATGKGEGERKAALELAPRSTPPVATMADDTVTAGGTGTASAIAWASCVPIINVRGHESVRVRGRGARAMTTDA